MLTSRNAEVSSSGLVAPDSWRATEGTVVMTDQHTSEFPFQPSLWGLPVPFNAQGS